MRAYLLGLLVLLAHVRDAEACSCEQVDTVVPGDGATSVPTNAIIFVRAATDSARFTLRRVTETTAIPLTAERHGSNATYAYLIRPPALAPDTTYELDVYVYGDSSLGRRSRFTTGAVDDTTPLDHAGLDAFEPRAMEYPADGCISSCAVRSDGRVAFAHLSYAAPADMVVALLEIRDANGEVIGSQPLVGEQLLEPAICGPVAPRLEPGETYCARVRVFDAAGNESGGDVERCAEVATCPTHITEHCEPSTTCTPQPPDVVLPDEGGCQAGPLPSLACGLLLLVRRRRGGGLGRVVSTRRTPRA